MRLILILALVFLVTSCGSSGVSTPGGSAEPDSVVASFYPLAYAAEQIGGGRVEVTNLTSSGAEPHDVELSVRDVERVRSADVIFYFGSGFQPAVERAAEGASGEAVDLLDGLDLRAEEEDEGGDSGTDPHVWLDPLRYESIAARIGEVIDRPEAAAAFARRLSELHAELEAGLEHCSRREIVTSHAAFGYLAARYDLAQIAITGPSPEVEPNARVLEQVIAEIREHGATTVFSETLVSPRLAETVARESGARTAVLNPLEGLTEDELARGEDYFSIMRANLAILREALGCR
jgi:zinc transport system substrate-binding protein